MKYAMKTCLTGIAIALQTAWGGVPIEWTRRPDSTVPANFTAHHGETLEFRCEFRGFGELPFGDGSDVRLYFQTNGMGEAWWSVPAAVSSNTVSAAWSPEMDSGADRWTYFFGRPGVVYASAIVRLVKSPGFMPGVLPPPAMFEETVAAIVTNKVDKWSEWEWSDGKTHKDPEHNGEDGGDGKWIMDYAEAQAYGIGELADGDEDSTRLVFGEYDNTGFLLIATRRWIKGGNTLGLAMAKDVVSAETVTNIAREVSAPITNEIDKLKKESKLVYRLFSGSNIVMEVTNNNSKANAPTMKLFRLNDEGEYELVWAETNGLERTYQRAVSNAAARVAEAERKASESYAPRAWGRTTSGLGADAPDGITWISTPQTVIAGGLEFQKTVTTSGQLWFLRSNGMMATAGESAGGFFEIAATDGTPVFSVEKTDSHLVGVDAASISRSGNTVTVTVPVVSDEHPLLRFSPSLKAPVTWQKEEDGFSSPVAVAWGGSSGAWRAVVTSSAKEGFFTFEFLQEGSVKLKSGGMMDVTSGGIMCTDGKHKCRPVYNTDGTVTWEVF